MKTCEKLVLTLTVLLLSSGQATASTSSASQMAASDLASQAAQCTSISVRLERLSCFDQLFNTPSVQTIAESVEQAPESWYRAFASVERYTDGMHSLLETAGDGKRDDAWVTLKALNQSTRFADNAKPVLIMSCLDNISHVDLALPSRVADSRVKISLAYAKAKIWRSDDMGLLFASGRGLPAIELMKTMSQGKRITLRSNAAFIDGLQFDSSDLKASLQTLRQRCGW